MNSVTCEAGVTRRYTFELTLSDHLNEDQFIEFMPLFSDNIRWFNEESNLSVHVKLGKIKTVVTNQKDLQNYAHFPPPPPPHPASVVYCRLSRSQSDNSISRLRRFSALCVDRNFKRDNPVLPLYRSDTQFPSVPNLMKALTLPRMQRLPTISEDTYSIFTFWSLIWRSSLRFEKAPKGLRAICTPILISLFVCFTLQFSYFRSFVSEFRIRMGARK